MVGGTWPGQAVNRGRRYLGEAKEAGLRSDSEVAFPGPPPSWNMTRLLGFFGFLASPK